MATIQLPTDFKEFLSFLDSEKVEYLLIGGHAVGYYGYPRATGDMDIWVAVHRENAARLVRVFRQFGFSTSAVTEETFLAKDKVIQMGVPPLRIDLLTGVPGVEFAQCYSDKSVGIIDGLAVNIISLEHLKTNKRASGRPKDQDDLDNLP